MATIGKIPGAGGVKGAGAPSDSRRVARHGKRPAAERDPIIHEPAAEVRQKAGEKIQPQAMAPDAPTLTDRALGAAGLATTAVNVAAMPVFIGSHIAGKAITETEELAKLGFFGRQRNRLAKFMGRVTEPTFGDVGRKLGVDKAAAAVVQPLANVTGDIAEGGFRGTFNRLRDRNLSKSIGGHALLKEQVGRIHASDVHGGLRPHVNEMHSLLNIADPKKFDAGRFEAAKKSFDGAAADIIEAGGGREIKATVKAVGKLNTKAVSMADHAVAATRYEHIGDTIKSVPKSIAKMSAVNGVMNAGFVGASALSMASDVRGFTKQLAVLKRMYADMTGRDAAKISTMEALLGNAPAPVRAARAHMLKFTAISEIADTVGLAVNLKGIIGKGFTNPIVGMMAFMIPQKISEGAGNMLGPNVLVAYDAISKAQKAGQQIGAGDYAQLLFLASPELKAKGENNPFIGAIAEQFAQSQTSAADVLKATTNGDITLRISQIMVANEAAKNASDTKTEVTTPEASISHAQRLNGKKEHPVLSRAEKPVVGAFSKNIVDAAAEMSPVAAR